MASGPPIPEGQPISGEKDGADEGRRRTSASSVTRLRNSAASNRVNRQLSNRETVPGTLSLIANRCQALVSVMHQCISGNLGAVAQVLAGHRPALHSGGQAK